MCLCHGAVVKYIKRYTNMAFYEPLVLPKGLFHLLYFITISKTVPYSVHIYNGIQIFIPSTIKKNPAVRIGVITSRSANDYLLLIKYCL